MTDHNSKTDNLDQLVEANQQFAEGFNQSHLKAPPSKRLAILTCMDCRMDPYKFAGLEDGQAHVIRNAGGRVTEDAIRSLVISHKFLGTVEWFVIQHTQCGMSTVNDQQIGELLAEDLETAVHDGTQWKNPQRDNSDNTKPGSDLGKSINWYTFTDLKTSVLEDIEIIKKHPLVPSHITVRGFIYDVGSGKLAAVTE